MRGSRQNSRQFQENSRHACPQQEVTIKVSLSKQNSGVVNFVPPARPSCPCSPHGELNLLSWPALTLPT